MTIPKDKRGRIQELKKLRKIKKTSGDGGPLRDRIVLALKSYGPMTVPEIAETLKVNQPGVRANMLRNRDWLKLKGVDSLRSNKDARVTLWYIESQLDEDEG